MKTPYTITQDSITVIWDGKPVTVNKHSANFAGLRKALLAEDSDSIPQFLTVAKNMQKWSKGKFTINGDVVKFGDVELPETMSARIVEMAKGGEDPTSVFKFWERLQKNPSFRSVQQLWSFLNQKNIPLTPDGQFLAYKSVDRNYKDHHSGKFTNKPGTVNRMPRNQISDDPNHACHEGFHVGAIEYAETFGGNADNKRIVICRVDPEHVVCVPYDSSQQKMRVCEYTVTGNYGQELPSTSFSEDEPKPQKMSRKAKKKAAKNNSRGFSKMAAMDMQGLMGQSIEALRQYASKGLNIVGASKISGGKTALVLRILDVRSEK